MAETDRESRAAGHDGCGAFHVVRVQDSNAYLRLVALILELRAGDTVAASR